MPTYQVTIEGTFTVTGRGVFVAARLHDRCNFTLTETATIGGCPIEPRVAAPRRLLPDGRPDLNYFVFWLRDPSDRSKLKTGQIVELKL